jgi:hypothetical protein
LLLHQNEGYHFGDEKGARLCVIDGQQRLTSLCIVYHALYEGELPANFKFQYRSRISVINISRVKRLLAAKAQLLDKKIFANIIFTVITVKSEDLAFTFFDTQNNRGVPLAATDLLKAFHLRAIDGKQYAVAQQMQKLCAARWEQVQSGRHANLQENTNDQAQELFNYYLWRARNWRGQRSVTRETHDDIIATFEQQTVAAADEYIVPLYANYRNRFASSLKLVNSSDHRLTIQDQEISTKPRHLPFSIRQPIHQGVGFFLYADKYADLLHWLFHETTTTADVYEFRRFHARVIKAQSQYLRELFELAVLMFVDRLGCQQLFEFALWLDHVLGSIRLYNSNVYKEAPLKYLKERKLNLLDVIVGAYRAEEVIEFLSSDSTVDEWLGSDKVTKVVESYYDKGKGVRERYLGAVYSYYGEHSLMQRSQAIADKLRELA